MKNTWLVWVFIVGIVVAALVAFNYHSEKSKVPLSEIFSEEQTFPVDVEYEFVEGGKPGMQATPSASAPASAPAQTAKAEETTLPATTAAVSSPVAKQTVAQALKPAPQAVGQEIAQAEYEKIAFTIQVASFKDKAHAERLTVELKTKGFSGYWSARNLGEKGIWYRVYVGSFDSKQQAEELLTKVKSEYSGSFIISPKR